MEIVQIRKRRYLKFTERNSLSTQDNREVMIEEDTIEAIRQDKKLPGLTIIICDTGDRYTTSCQMDDIIHLLQGKE